MPCRKRTKALKNSGKFRSKKSKNFSKKALTPTIRCGILIELSQISDAFVRRLTAAIKIEKSRLTVNLENLIAKKKSK